jgi:hypothetical protein
LRRDRSVLEAQRIGRREFKDLCDACGITKGLKNVELLKFIPYKIRVGIEKDKSGIYDDRNKVTRVWPASKGPPVSSQVPAPKPPAPPSAAKPSAAKPSAAKPSAATSIEKMMAEGAVRFTDYQSPNSGTPPQASPPQASSNGGTPPQAASQVPPQTPPQTPPPQVQPAMQSSPETGSDGDLPPWRK